MAFSSRSFLESQFCKLDPRWAATIKDAHAWIKCPYHGGGNERTGSLRINLEPKTTDKGTFAAGSGYCYGCGKFVSSWNVLAKTLGLDGLGPETTESAAHLISPQLRRALLEETDAEVPSLDKMLPWNPAEEWRTVSGKIMKAVGARIMFDEKIERMLAYLPCMVEEEHIGGIRANIKKYKKRNYFNTDGPWVKERGLYPYDYTKSMMEENNLSTLMIVEGPRDALKSIQAGIPALAILGTGNWSESKAELILALEPSRVISGLDPDEAGTKATRKIYKSLKQDVPWFKRFPFPDDIDPGNMSDEIAQRIKRLIK